MEEQQTNSIDTSVSSKTAVIDKSSEVQTSSNSAKKQKKIKDISSESPVSKKPISIYHQDISFNKKNVDYCSFSTPKKKPSESNPVQQILDQAAVHIPDLDSDEDEEKKKIAAAKKLLFPNAFATSFSEVSDTLRNERRQEFCPIYKDETPEEILLRQSKQKPIGSLLEKRVRWDDLKRKREEEEKKKASQIPIHYGPYGPIYSNQQQRFSNPYEKYNGKMQNQSQQSFANPYEQYYAAMQNQYEQMIQMTRAQQEHNGFWPEYQQQQSIFQNNNQITQNSMQQQSQFYTYPYPAMYSTNMTTVNNNIPSSYTSTDYHLFLNNLMQPPPPPPNEPYPY